MKALIFSAIMAFAVGPCVADQLVVIDLLHLNAETFARSLSGGGDASDVLSREAADFAVEAMQDVTARGRGRTDLPHSISYSRARSIPDGAADLSSLLPDGLSAPPMAAPGRNALLVRGRPEAIDEFREVIATVDLPTPMVNVDLQMDETTVTRVREISPYLEAWGWGGEVRAGQRPSRSRIAYTVGNLRAMLGYDARDAYRRKSTATNVTGMSGMPLVISVGEARPRIVSEVYYDHWGRRRVHHYPEAVFAGVTLWVMPTVHADDSVTMVLRPMLSEVVGPAPQVGAGDIVRRTMVETTVRVPDGQSLVIGGLDRHLDDLSRSFPASSGRTRGDSSSVITVSPTIVRMRGSGR